MRPPPASRCRPSPPCSAASKRSQTVNGWYPGEVPEGVDLQVAYNQPGIGRYTQYGRTASGEAFGIFSGTSAQPIVSMTDVDIDGHTWSVSVEQGYGAAVWASSDVGLSVTGEFESIEDLTALIRNLVVVETQLPRRPLTFSQEAMTPVAAFTADSRTFQMSAEADNGWYCLFTTFGPDTSAPGVAGDILPRRTCSILTPVVTERRTMGRSRLCVRHGVR